MTKVGVDSGDRRALLNEPTAGRTDAPAVFRERFAP